MHDNELKALWRAQPIDPVPPLPNAVQMAEMQNRMEDLDRVLSRRDLRENIAAIVVILIFGAYFFIFSSPLARAGSAIVMLSGVFVMIYPTWRRRRLPKAPPDATLMQSLECELRKVEVEIALLRSVHWWYILPGAVGVIVFLLGLGSSGLSTLVIVGCVIALDLFIYWINQVACDKNLVPLKREVESLLEIDAPAPAARSWRSSIIPISAIIATGVFLVLFIRSASHVEEPRVPPFEDVSAFAERDVASIDAWLEEQVAAAKFPSLSVAIVREGTLVYERAFGYADIKAGREATPETAYHVASVTKVFTTSLAVLLEARGVINLDDAVVKYLPEGTSLSRTPELGATITLRQLATHTAGLPRGVPGRVQSAERRYALESERFYKLLGGVLLAYPPGSAELYSNLGMGLLGHALERAAGKPLEMLVREMLCEPLGLERTAIEGSETFPVATGYGRGIPRTAETHSLRQRLAGSGGLIASGPDLAKFLTAQMRPGIFTREMLAQLHTPARLSDGSPARTALGWSVRSSRSAGRILQKNGGRNNTGAWIGFAPEHGVGVVVLTNCGEPDVDPIGRWLLDRAVPQAATR